MKPISLFKKAKWIFGCLLWCTMIICSYCTQNENSTENGELEPQSESQPKGVVDGIHTPTGLVYAEGFDLVSSACTGCHSAKLITQSRATREGWIDMIRWMQKTQGLGNLGDFEQPIVDYLAKHYAPEDQGRRQPLNTDEIQWYDLALEQ